MTIDDLDERSRNVAIDYVKAYIFPIRFSPYVPYESNFYISLYDYKKLTTAIQENQEVSLEHPILLDCVTIYERDSLEYYLNKSNRAIVSEVNGKLDRGEFMFYCFKTELSSGVFLIDTGSSKWRKMSSTARARVVGGMMKGVANPKKKKGSKKQ